MARPTPPTRVIEAILALNVGSSSLKFGLYERQRAKKSRPYCSQAAFGIVTESPRASRRRHLTAQRSSTSIG